MPIKIGWSQALKLVQNHKFQLIIIILLAFFIRLYRITNPVLDWHAFRQADTASVTYRYSQEGINLLEPKYHDLSNIQSGLENPEGHRMVEFPIINALIAGLLITFPQLDIVVTSRFFSVLFSLGTLLAFYWLIKQISYKKLALVSTAFLAFLPFSVYYSRVILPEPFMLFFSTLSLATLTAYLKQQKLIYWWLSWVSLALGLLLKPFIAFLGPVYMTLIMLYDSKFYKKIYFYLYPILAFVPLALWRLWIANFTQGIPASDWLLNTDGIRFRPAWFRWLFWERITKLISGVAGIFLILANILNRNRIFLILASWWLGILGFFIVIATGNVRHDYYQVLILPCISLTLGRGSLLLYDYLTQQLRKRVGFSRIISGSIVVLLSLTIFIIGWFQVKGFYNVNNWEYLRAGQEADQLLPPESKVIAPAMGDTMFLFQTRRNGWPIGHHIEEKIELGATHYITTSFDKEAAQLEKKFITVKKTSEYMIIDLTSYRNQQGE